MGIFDRFPYSSTHEMNLDFMLGKATEIAEEMQQVTAGMEQVQAGLSAISEKTEQATQAAAQAAASASSIEGSVTAAEEAAEEAQMHNESAQTWANNAMTYKADCQRAATEAAASSSSAAQAATAAAASEDTVAQYAQAANASAQSAANNNDSAHQYANQASASASNATFHSSNAQTAATNAQTAATNASASADRAAFLKTDVETLHRMCAAAVDQAATEAVNAANSAAQAAATKTDVETLVESLPEDFTDLNNTVNQLSDDIGNLKSAVVTYSENTLKDANKWVNGSVNTSDGTQFSSSTRILSYIFTNIVSYTADDGYTCRVFGYDKNMNYLGIWKGTEFRTNAGDSQFTSLSFGNLYDRGALYFRIVVLKTNGDAISTSECNNVEFVFEKYAERQLYIREPFTLGNTYLLDGMNVKNGDSNKYFYYEIGDTFYFRTQFTFPKDIHSQTHNYPLFNISGLANVSFDKAVTSQNSVQPIEPVPVYNAGFRISGIPGESTDVVLHPDGWRKELLLGADAVTFRFTGDCSNTENQDIRLSVDADYVSVYHSTNNSIIHKFTKASYLTMRELYDAITTEIESGDLTEFEAEWLNVDNLTPDDIIECDVALVGEYPTGNENSPTRYDAFPFYFTTKQGTGKKYNVEVLLNKNAEQLNYIILINGYAVYQRKNIFPLFNQKVKITLYDESENGIKLHEVECGIAPKSIYPSIANIFIEGIDIGLDKSSQGIRSSSKRVFGVSEYMKNLGREYVTMNDIQRIFDGGIATKSNYLWVMHIDDARHDSLNFATNSKLRGELIAHGVYPSAAFMLNGGELSSAEKVCVTATSVIGFDYHIHTAYTDGLVNMNYYSYDQLNNNVTEAIEKFIEYFGTVPVAWGIHAGSLEYRISRYLKNKGFRFIFGGVSETDNALNEITRYGCKRTSALDSVAYSTYNRLKESY